ncbi:unnamed protein product [Citrullus colocynthis]|uniref:Uncharacterized protein n=1 Tax=Citrullus colocynthis TaxID=252529 RepID=A0ABP0Y656_9ROSI
MKDKKEKEGLKPVIVQLEFERVNQTNEAHKKKQMETTQKVSKLNTFEENSLTRTASPPREKSPITQINSKGNHLKILKREELHVEETRLVNQVEELQEIDELYIDLGKYNITNVTAISSPKDIPKEDEEDAVINEHSLETILERNNLE